MVWYGRVGLKDKVKSSLSPRVCRIQKFVYSSLIFLRWYIRRSLRSELFCVIVISNLINYCLLVACHATLYPALSVCPSVGWLVGRFVSFLNSSPRGANDLCLHIGQIFRFLSSHLSIHQSSPTS